MNKRDAKTAAPSESAKNKFSLTGATIGIIFASFLVSSISSFVGVRALADFNVAQQKQAILKQQNDRERRAIDEEERKKALEQTATAAQRANDPHYDMLQWEHEQRVKLRNAIQNLEYLERQENYRNRSGW